MRLTQKFLPLVGGPHDGKTGTATALSLGDSTIWSSIPIKGPDEESVYRPEPKDDPVRLVYSGYVKKHERA